MNKFLIFCILSFPLYGMKEFEQFKLMEEYVDKEHFKQFVLFRGLKRAIKHDLKSDDTPFSEYFNTITQPNPKIKITPGKQNTKEVTLVIKAQKKEKFHCKYFKKNLIKFYKNRVSYYKKPFEEQGRTLGTNFGEDDTSLTFAMFLREEQSSETSEEEIMKKKLKEKLKKLGDYIHLSILLDSLKDLFKKDGVMDEMFKNGTNNVTKDAEKK